MTHCRAIKVETIPFLLDRTDESDFLLCLNTEEAGKRSSFLLSIADTRPISSAPFNTTRKQFKLCACLIFYMIFCHLQMIFSTFCFVKNILS